MPNSNTITSTPQALIVNPDFVGASQLSNHLINQGISIISTREVDITSDSAAAVDYIAWYTNNIQISALVINSLNLTHKRGLKILLILNLDEPVNDAQVEEKNSALVNQISNDLFTLGKQKNIDIRIIMHQGVYSAEMGKGSPSIEKMIDNLKEGIISIPKNELMYLIETSFSVSSIINIWFDRGHRGKSIKIRGNPINIKVISDQVCTRFPHVIKSTNDPWWVSGEGIAAEEILEIQTESNAFYNFLVSTVKPISPKVVSLNQTTETFYPIVEPLNQVEKVPIAPVAVVNPIPPRTVTPPKKIVKVTTSAPAKPSNKIKYISSGVMVALIAFIMPAIILYIAVYQSNKISANNSIQEITTTQNNINRASKITNSIYGWIRQVEAFDSVSQKQIKLENSAREKLLIARAQAEISQAIKLIVTATQGDPFVPLQKAKYTLDELYIFQSTHVLESNDNRQWVIESRQAINIIPQLIPVDKKITIMMLLQNNLELRPTGGFIGAVSLLTFDHGKLLDMDNRDIYDLDSNLKGIVNPPSELKTYLGESSWFFRDANWSPDFIDSASTSNWFLEKEWGTAADVVVGVNINTIKMILRATGPITLPDGQIISADNIMVTAFNHQDLPVAKRESKKQEFLSQFIKPFIDQISQGDNNQIILFLKAIGEAINSGEMMIVSSQPSVLSELIDANWSGKIKNPQCPSNYAPNCWSDFIYLNEANVGINKSNFYINRMINHTVSLSDTQSNHIHSIEYKNLSPTDGWPGGSYKTYSRLHIPFQAKDVIIKLNNQNIAFSNLNSINDANYQTLGFFHEIKPQTTSFLEISYSIQKPSDYRSYIFNLQKQPGSFADQATVSIATPLNKIISKTNAQIGNDQLIKTSGVFSKNQTISIEFNP